MSALGRTVLGFAITTGVVLVGLGAFWAARGRPATYYTDGASIRHAADDAPVRDVLWREPARLAFAAAHDGTGFDDGGFDGGGFDGGGFDAAVSRDGLTLLIVRGVPGHDTDLFVATRTADGWDEPRPLAAVNSRADELAPELASDGRTLYFSSNRVGGAGGYDVWRSRRDGDTWTEPENLGPRINSAFDDYGACPSTDGRTLFLSSNRPRSPASVGDPRTDYDLFVATLDGNADARPLTTLNSTADEGAPALSPAGDFLYFASDRPGGRGGFDLYRARAVDAGFDAPENLAPPVNTPAHEIDPAVTAEGFGLLFTASTHDGEATGYALHFTTSREVYTVRGRAPPIDWAAVLATVAPVLWILLLLLLLLLVLPRLVRRVRASAGMLHPLSLLVRCLIVSIVVHALLLVGLMVWAVTTGAPGIFPTARAHRVALVAPPSGDGIAAQLTAPLTEPTDTTTTIAVAAREIVRPAEPPRVETAGLDPAAAPPPPGTPAGRSPVRPAATPPPLATGMPAVTITSAAPVTATVTTTEPTPIAEPRWRPTDTPPEAAATRVATRATTAMAGPDAAALPPQTTAIATEPVPATVREATPATPAPSPPPPTLRAERTDVTLPLATAVAERPVPEHAAPMTPQRTPAVRNESAPTVVDATRVATVAPAPPATGAPTPLARGATRDGPAPPPRPAAGRPIATTAPPTAAPLLPADAAARPVVESAAAVSTSGATATRHMASATKTPPALARTATLAPATGRPVPAIPRADVAPRDARPPRMADVADAPTAGPETGVPLELATPAAVAETPTTIAAAPLPTAAAGGRPTALPASTPDTLRTTLARPAPDPIRVPAGPVTEATAVAREAPAPAPSTTPLPDPTAPSTLAVGLPTVGENAQDAAAARNPTVPVRAGAAGRIALVPPDTAASSRTAVTPPAARPTTPMTRPTFVARPAVADGATPADRPRSAPASPAMTATLPLDLPVPPTPAGDPSAVPDAVTAGPPPVRGPAERGRPSLPAPATSASALVAIAPTRAVPTRPDAPTDRSRRVEPADAALASSAAARPPSAEARTLAPRLASTLPLPPGDESFVRSATPKAPDLASAGLRAEPPVSTRRRRTLPAVPRASSGLVTTPVPPDPAGLTPSAVPIEARPATASRPIPTPMPTAPGSIAGAPALDVRLPDLAVAEPPPAAGAPLAASAPSAGARVAVVLPPTRRARPHADPGFAPVASPPTDRAAATASARAPLRDADWSAPAGDRPMAATLAPLDVQLPSNLARPSNPYPQRAPEQRAAVLEREGGGPETERAVAMALEWLARHQSEDGHWDSRGFDEACGQCGGDARLKVDVATTGLALLCFLAADHTHVKAGPYRTAVERGLAWLRGQQAENGDLRTDESMYSHGIATIALAEAYGMTGDPRLAEAVPAAVRFLYRARNTQTGGWRYAPGQAGDTSVLGWQVMAMISARRSGLDTPDEGLDVARRWLDRVSDDDTPGLYAYQPQREPTAAMTAEGLYVQQLLGRDRDAPRMQESAAYVLAHPPAWDGIQTTYYWLYATLALFQHGGDEWRQWNEAIKDVLLERQHQTGAAAGTWDPEDVWAQVGGRVYQTAVCTLTLEVYYRYLPAYVREREVGLAR